jgi:hypothetical protein
MADESKAPYTLKAQGNEVAPDESNPKLLTWTWLARAQKIQLNMPREVRLQLHIHDADGHDLPGRKFQIEQSGKVTEGTVGDDGVLHAMALAGEDAKLIVIDGDKHHEYDLSLGPLDKPETPRGAQQRLASLGYEVAVNGLDDQNFKRALAEFQHDHALASALLADLATAIDAAYLGK